MVNPNGECSIAKAFKKYGELVEVWVGEKELNKKIVDVTKTFFPNIVFVQVHEGGKIHPTVIKHLRSLSAFVINWNGDIRHDTPLWMIEQANDYSVTTFSNMRDVKHLRSLGLNSEWLEIGYDQDIYNPVGPVNNNVKPIVFFGNNVHSFPMSNYRTQMCMHLKMAFRDQFGVYGMQQGSDGNFNSSQYDEAAAYRNAKIAINLSHFEVEKYTSDRMYRILGTGVMCLAKRYPGIEEQFTDGVNLVMWDNIPELIEKVKHYMANDSERIAIAKAGNELALKEYTFDSMVKNMIKLYEKTI